MLCRYLLAYYGILCNLFFSPGFWFCAAFLPNFTFGFLCFILHLGILFSIHKKAAGTVGICCDLWGAKFSPVECACVRRGVDNFLKSECQTVLSFWCRNFNQHAILVSRVYVGSIYFEIKEDTIKQAFMPFGPIRSLNLSWDAISNKHKGMHSLYFALPCFLLTESMWAVSTLKSRKTQSSRPFYPLVLSIPAILAGIP